jgi:hypothetical protein
MLISQIYGSDNLVSPKDRFMAFTQTATGTLRWLSDLDCCSSLAVIRGFSDVHLGAALSAVSGVVSVSVIVSNDKTC